MCSVETSNVDRIRGHIRYHKFIPFGIVLHVTWRAPAESHLCQNTAMPINQPSNQIKSVFCVSKVYHSHISLKTDKCLHRSLEKGWKTFRGMQRSNSCQPAVCLSSGHRSRATRTKCRNGEMACPSASTHPSIALPHRVFEAKLIQMTSSKYQTCS